jgi:hypothetical protein
MHTEESEVGRSHHEDKLRGTGVIPPLLGAMGLASLLISTQTIQTPVTYHGLNYALPLTIGGVFIGLGLLGSGWYLLVSRRRFLSLHAHAVVAVYFLIVLFLIQLTAYLGIFIILHYVVSQPFD